MLDYDFRVSMGLTGGTLSLLDFPTLAGALGLKFFGTYWDHQVDIRSIGLIG